MENYTLLKRLKDEVHGFFEEAARASEPVYLVLLSLYVAIYYMLKIAWAPGVSRVAEMVRYGILGIVMWGAAAYLFFIIAAWKDLWRKNVPLIATGLVLIAVTGIFSAKMSTNVYGVVMDAYFCLMAYKKDYRKMLLCLLGVGTAMLLLAGIGMAAGITMDLEKPLNVSPGHSLGIIYPNTWGYLAFLVMLITWYLFLRRKWLITFLLFWSVSVFMYFYVSCRTITGFSVLFPFLAAAVDRMETKVRAAAGKDEEGKKKAGRRIAECLVTGIPFIAFAAMLFVSLQVEWVHKHFYPTPLLNFAMRFVQGGLYFRTYGFPLIGNPYRSNQITYVNVNGVFEKVGILDSSFAAYIIMRGMIWLFCTLLWLCFAHWRALKKKDYAIPLLESFILLFAMMERPGLEMWYNFVMLYPLAKVIGTAAEEKTEAPAELKEADEPEETAEPEGTEEPEETAEPVN